ncbi:MAG: twin-arginine translocase TatA/TatE family subunit [Candidatus Euphemobacter frigidus]|nr:twin-arginine translocase TatA/TatE family subunit [Candidatus Euphemobacter frigidus]MDP8276775.1 twin-arginine translocase TatA/TatE family subunit [Candidatus Euphemobacter frigidus]
MPDLPVMFLGAPGWLEILLILVVVLLLFGAKKLPEVMGSFGKGVKEFKKGVKDIGRELEADKESEDEKSDTPRPPEEEEKKREGEKQPDGEGS